MSCTAWCLKNESVHCVVLGASNVDQLYEDMQAIQVAYACNRAVILCTILRVLASADNIVKLPYSTVLFINQKIFGQQNCCNGSA